jgi:ADP-heptose:LPS heptosyltransferase
MHTETNNCIATRNFTINDYYKTESILKNNKMIGVIVTDVESILPDKIKDSFIDLSGKTSIEESIEILKACHGYIGIDSFLSIVASKIFTSNDVIIKSNNKHAYNWENIYWYPFTSKLNSIIF